MNHRVFVTGATGYLGRAIIPALLARGHRVRALCRKESASRIPSGAETVVGNALDERTYRDSVAGCDTFIHLVGTPHPTPSKAQQFREVDLVSVAQAIAAATQANVSHFIYLSVPRPAPVMHAYLAVRAEGERMLAASGIPSTFVRPWYVLGPGHRWPVVLLPVYAVAAAVPAWREGARRLALLRLSDVVRTMVRAVEEPITSGTRAIEGAEIRMVATRTRVASFP